MRKEIDLRQELEDTFNGTSTEIAKAYKILIRRFRLDSVGRKIECVCNQNGEGSKDPQCNFCLGEGYYWDEEFEDTFKVEVGSESAKARRLIFRPHGILYPELTRFFFRYNTDIVAIDKIIEMEKDTEGNLIQPYRRGVEWRIQQIEEKRSDIGRLEYVIAYCSKETIHYYNRIRNRRAE